MHTLVIDGQILPACKKRWESFNRQHEDSDEDPDDGGICRPRRAAPPAISVGAKARREQVPAAKPLPWRSSSGRGPPLLCWLLAAAPLLAEGGTAGDLHSTGPVKFERLVSGMRIYLCNRPPSGPFTKLLFLWSAPDATSPRGWDLVRESRLQYDSDDSFTVQDRAYWVRYDSETCFLAGLAYTLVRLNGAFVPQSATDYQLLSVPRSISTASLQPDYLRPHSIDVNPMDAPLVGGSMLRLCLVKSNRTLDSYS
jgi:hypothetical protein